MDAHATIRAYYDALRAGEPLHPFFYEDERTVKFGVGETLAGYEAVAAGLRAQTETTTDWELNSRDLVVGASDESAWFADDVFMGWTDTDANMRYEFDTRWSGSLLRVDDGWRFTGMHVSCPVETSNTGAATR